MGYIYILIRKNQAFLFLLGGVQQVCTLHVKVQSKNSDWVYICNHMCEDSHIYYWALLEPG